MKKKFCLALMAMVTALVANAQSIECRKTSTVPAGEVIGNYAAITFIATGDKWIIEPVSKKGVNDQPVQRSVNGTKTCYEFRVDVEKDHERTYIISKRGSSLQEQVVAKNIRRNTRTMYEVTEVSDTLDRIELQENGRRGVYPEDGKACVEITTTIEGLDIHTAWEKKESSTTAGARSVLVIVDIDQIKAVKAQLDSLAAIMADMEARGEYLQMESVMQQQEAKEQWYAEHTTIMLGGNGIKPLSLSLLEVSPKERVRYAVVAMKMSECMSLMDEGDALFKSMKYADAKRVYASALKAKDVTESLVPSINSHIMRCDSCINYFQRLVGVLGLIKERKESSDKVSQYDVASYYYAAIEYMQILYRYNPIEYYKKNIEALEKAVGDMPFLIRFTVVKWVSDRVSASEGGAMADVDIWAYYGDKASMPAKYKDNETFRKAQRVSGDKFHHVGVTDENGVVDMELRRSTLPTGFFFAPVNVKIKADVVYRDMEEVMSQAKHEYNKRQFRLKMYIKK